MRRFGKAAGRRSERTNTPCTWFASVGLAITTLTVGVAAVGVSVPVVQAAVSCTTPSAITVTPTSPAAILEGATSTYAMTGGTVAGGTATYGWGITPWLGATPSGASGTTTGVVTFSRSGVFTVTFTATNNTVPAGCSPTATSTAFVSQIVDPLPAPTIINPIAGLATPDTTPLFDGTAQPGTTVTVTSGATTLCTSPVPASGDWSCVPPEPIATGLHNVTATQAVPDGGASPAALRSFLIDVTPPGAPTIAAPAESSTTRDGTPTISGSGEAGATVTVTEGATTLCTSVVGIGGTWSCDSTVLLVDGPHTVMATQADRAGNLSPDVTRGFMVDSTAPNAPVVSSPAPGSAIGDSTPTFSGTGEVGATVTVDEGGVTWCSTTVLATGIWFCSPTVALPDGPHTVSVTQADGAGNPSPVVTQGFAVDTMAPAPPVVSGPVQSSTTGDNTPAFSGTGDVGASVTVTEGGVTLCTATVLADGTWSCSSTTVLTDGPHSASVTQMDAAGNTSTATTRGFAVDTVAPSAPAVAGPAETSTTGATPIFSGTGEVGATVEVTEGGTTLCTAIVGVGGAWSCSPTVPLVDGPHVVVVTQTDPAGNTGLSETQSFTVDGTAPVPPAVTGPAEGSVTGTMPTISGTGEAGATVTVTEGGVTICTATVGAGGNWSCVATTPLSSGPHTVSATQSDRAGNTSTADTQSFVVDATAPAGPVISAPAAGASTSDTTPEFTGTGEPGAVVTVMEHGVQLCSATVNGLGQWSCTPTVELAGGLHDVSASQTDPSGNTSSATPRSFVVDAVAPLAPSIAVPASGTAVNDNTPTITGTGEPGATVSVKDGSTIICTTTVAANGTWTCTPATPLVDGPHSLVVTQTDAAGNTSSATTQSLPIDTVRPAPVTVVGPSTGSEVSTLTPTIRGTGEAGALVTVIVDGSPVCTATVSVDGTWSCTPTAPLTAGSHTFAITQADAAGNVAETASGTFSVVVPTAQVSGRVFTDLNGNGVPDGDDIDISNVTLGLFSGGADRLLGTADDVEIARATTRSPFLFPKVADGIYEVRVLASPALEGYSATNRPTAKAVVTVANQVSVLDLWFGYVKRGGALPITGAGGTRDELTLGLVLVSLGGVLLVSRKRRLRSSA